MPANADLLLNEAIVIYLGFGLLSYPQPDSGRVEARFGEDGARLASAAASICAELDQFKPDWTVMDLNQATDTAVAAMRDRHPELSEQALQALDWHYSFAWR